MRKVLLISGLALAVAGCAAQQGQAPQVQVRDLSASRESTAAGTYTVEAGDTLYGIAWRHSMDYRDLARLNQISPPYQIQPGQQLALTREGEAAARASTGETAGDRGVVATGLGGQQVSAEPGTNMEWLLPDEEAIERNRRLTAERLEDEGGIDGPSEVAMESAAGVTGSGQGPGPVYDYDSPGADGSLSGRDLAERRAAQEQAERQPEPRESAEQPAEPVEAPSRELARDEPEPEPERRQEEAPPGPDAGTAVAGASEPSQDRDGRSYTPVDEVAWRWPVDGEIVGRFGEGSTITAGIDIAGQKGQPVRAAGPGIVVYAGSGVRGYGNLILLKHNDQFLSAYAHNDSLRVSENDVVEAGEVIATMGDSDAEDVRLHFEVRKDGQPQDPLEFLPPR
ncbi:peptidoglycan DD-metalloendopeptidase family protein [Halomonas heilongjiangensis]|uniref:Peptidase M23 n=1 Tax=Halomonas heilongjiangensis TaxID=1387883 RepID=A0A2N7TIG8_9GAMM|nr:peptidoglycan DD-metalloendopeptidase family protein [Halomonas heilongjiangensis]PMR67984.1 peptidase M23 [Halomonas heilongjiangensis]PXX86909.1 peptidase M23 [Halomonas heilongjiangensis]